MMDERRAAFWARAQRIDESLSSSRRASRQLAALEIRPVRYSRAKLFRSMARQEVVLFRDHPVGPPLRAFFLTKGGPEGQMKSLFRPTATTLTKSGPAQRRAHLSVHEAVDIWQRNRRVFSANDVFYRSLGLDRVFDCSAFCDFNVLWRAPWGLRELEVATLLMGTIGAMSDSHSDDPDGTNHCIMGRKLWLVWDRLEGRDHGLEDCEYDDVSTRAKFDLETFMTLQSARWFTVSTGTTLFLPGSFTHKVITIERYLGLSSFYVALPNALASLARWILRPTNMIKPHHRVAIAKRLVRRLRVTSAADRATKHRWGFYYVHEAAEALHDMCTSRQREVLAADPAFSTLAAEMVKISGCMCWRRRSIGD